MVYGSGFLRFSIANLIEADRSRREFVLLYIGAWKITYTILGVPY